MRARCTLSSLSRSEHSLERHLKVVQVDDVELSFMCGKRNQTKLDRILQGQRSRCQNQQCEEYYWAYEQTGEVIVYIQLSYI